MPISLLVGQGGGLDNRGANADASPTHIQVNVKTTGSEPSGSHGPNAKIPRKL